MYRILKCDKDGYITNKVIFSTVATNSRSTDANTGQSSTLDMFCLKDEVEISGSSSVVELSRAFLHFNLDPLRSLTGSILDIRNSSFKCFVSLKDIYGGQTTPSNFSLVLNPLAKTFSEGRGMDVIGYRDIDAVNWITASIISGNMTLWTSQGCSNSGSLGASGLDYYVSGVLASPTTASLFYVQNFERGDEDLLIDVTTAISATMAGILPDNGFRLAYVPSQEEDGVTRFVKRFSARHVRDPNQHPKLIVKYNDSFIDNQLNCNFDVTNNVGIYNTYFGQYRNFFLNNIAITGSNCLMLKLVASKSVQGWSSSFSPTHSMSINHMTSSFAYCTYSFTGSQLSYGNNFITGVYTSSISIASTDSALLTYLSGSNEANFVTMWKSLDGVTLFTSGSDVKIKKILGGHSNVAERNFVCNVTNLKTQYTQDEIARLRIFIQNYNVDLISYQVPIELKSEIYKVMHWRLVNAFSRKVLIPFDLIGNSTRLSADGNGMYFDLYMNDLEKENVYELEFLVRENDQDFYINDNGFKFKVIA